MEARSPHWRTALLPVCFALLCVTLMIATWVSFGGSVPLAADGYRIRIVLPQATNVFEDTSVRIAGITVGRVISVARSSDRAVALVELEPSYAPLRAGATAIVRAKTLLGEGYIEIAPGPGGARALPDGGTLPAANVRSQQQLFDLLRTFSPPTRARVRALFAGLAAAVHGRSASLSGALGYAAPLTADLGSVAAAVSAQLPSLRGLIADTGTVLSALGTREGEIQSFVRSGDSALQVTARSQWGLRATIAALPPFLAQLRSTSILAAGVSGELGAATGSLDAGTRPLVPALHAIDGATPVFRRLFERLPDVLAAGDAGLPRLDAVLDAARPALPQAYTTARQLIPVLQLLSADRTSVVGALANAAQINNGVLDAPGLGAIHYASGAVTVWNETVGGWIHKLPTNRSNPYPAPDSELDIAHGGLRAYDCRNTHNPLLLAPTGAGAPPCLLQGPWTFGGRSAYYPRLLQAPR